MPAFRINHMELTLPPGTLEKEQDAICAFYSEVFGFEAIPLPVPAMETPGLVLRTDEHTSQFLLLSEQEQHIQSPGFDHLGFIYSSRAEVDAIREQCGQWASKDERLQIKDYDDIVIGPSTTRAFYVRYLLPIWFDVQTVEYEPGTEPANQWVYQ
jgi:glyoxalase/bleomycin resistance protein/dioxygenase superfamily protein